MPDILVDIALAFAAPQRRQRGVWGWAALLTHGGNEKQISGTAEAASILEATLAGVGQALKCLKRPSTARLHMLLKPEVQAFLEGGVCPPGFPQAAIEQFLTTSASHRMEWDSNIPKTVLRKLGRTARSEAEPFLEPEPAPENRRDPLHESASPDRPARAGQSWSLEEEVLLTEMLVGGKSFEEISQCLERTRGSIQARVLTLFEVPFREWLQRELPTHLEQLRQKAHA